MSNREGSLYEIIESSTPKRNAVQGNAQADESCPGAPTRLASPELYMILDVDELQKQVNRLENRVSRMDRAAARARWRRKP